MSWYHWLVADGLWRDVLATVIAVTGARLVAWRPLRHHARRQQEIIDLLDTSKPGGLTDVVNQLREQGPPAAGPRS